MTTVKCNKCGHIAPWEDWPKGNDFFQNKYVSRCLNPDCDNRQSPGNASLRMMSGMESPFSVVRPRLSEKADPLTQVLYKANEAS